MVILNWGETLLLANSQLLLAYKQQTYPERFAGNSTAMLVLNYSKGIFLCASNLDIKEYGCQGEFYSFKHDPFVALMTDLIKKKKRTLLRKQVKKKSEESQVIHCYNACEFLEREEKGRICVVF